MVIGVQPGAACYSSWPYTAVYGRTDDLVSLYLSHSERHLHLRPPQV